MLNIAMLTMLLHLSKLGFGILLCACLANIIISSLSVCNPVTNQGKIPDMAKKWKPQEKNRNYFNSNTKLRNKDQLR